MSDLGFVAILQGFKVLLDKGMYEEARYVVDKTLEAAGCTDDMHKSTSNIRDIIHHPEYVRFFNGEKCVRVTWDEFLKR